MKQLKVYLSLNSVFSALSGLTMLFFVQSLSELFGIRDAFVFPIIGVCLLVFSAFVWIVSRRHLTNRRLVSIITIMDLCWVIGSFAVVAAELFGLSKTGYVLISVVALWIAYLAYNQFRHNR